MGKNLTSMYKKSVLDDFGTMPNTQAVLVDKNFFMVWDKLYQTTNQYNAQGSLLELLAPPSSIIVNESIS